MSDKENTPPRKRPRLQLEDYWKGFCAALYYPLERPSYEAIAKQLVKCGEHVAIWSRSVWLSGTCLIFLEGSVIEFN